MEDYAKLLLEETDSDVVAIHQFMLLCDEDRDDIHLFYEGDDDGLFYTPEVRRRASQRSLHQYICGGKKNVIEAREYIEYKGYNAKCLYFIDRDYDDYFDGQPKIDNNTYLTDGYSVESSICSMKAISVCLEDLLKLNNNDDRYIEIESIFNSLIGEFRYLVRLLTAWILAAKEEGLNPNLRNTVGLKKVVSLDANGNLIIGKTGFQYFKRNVIGNQAPPRLGNILRWFRLLEIEESEKWIRGKYVYWFYHTYIVEVVERVNKRPEMENGKKVRIPASLRAGHLFECLGGRIPPADTFVKFLDHHFN